MHVNGVRSPSAKREKMTNETEKLKKELIGHLTDEQREIAETLDRPLFVAAGAGSGKTTTLTSRVVWALTPGSGENGKPYLESIDELLVITFTRAAANEIKERIRTALRGAGLQEEALKVDNAWISTIHGMCSRLLKRHAFSIGIDPEFTFLTESEARYMLDSATEKVCRRVMNEDCYKEIFTHYKYSAQSNGRESSSSIKSMIQELVSQAISCRRGIDEIVFADPDNRKLNYYSELKDLRNNYDAMVFHRCKDDLELAKVVSALDELEEFLDSNIPANVTAEVLPDLVKSLHRPDGRKWRSKDNKDLCKESQQIFDKLHVESEFYANKCNVIVLKELAREVYNEYSAMKKQESKLDPDDLLNLTQELLERPEIAELYANQFKLVMIDEFQDTNRTQVDLISRLSGENERHLCTVGDAQQSIYRFNGADVAVFNERKNRMDEQTFKTMHKNFRSHDDILRFTARMCGKESMIPDFMDLEAGRFNEPGNAFDGKRRVYVEHTFGDPVEDHARLIADRLARLHDEGVPLGDMALLLGSMTSANQFVDELRKRGLSAVITGGSTFTSAPEVLALQPLLHTLSNPHDLETGLFPLLTGDMFRLDANDMVLLSTHYDENADRTNKWPLQNGMLNEEVYKNRQISARLKNAMDVMNRAWNCLSYEPFGDVLLGVMRDSGWLHRLYGEGISGQGKLANVFAAIDYINELSRDASLGVARIAHEFDLWLESAREQPAILMGDRLDAIAVTTIHKSKGLEYPVVAVAQINPSRSPGNLVFHNTREGIFAALKPGGMKSKFSEVAYDYSTPDEPSSLTQGYKSIVEIEQAAELEEKVRLLYVALTRARECVILGLNTPKKNSKNPTITSLMLDALDANLEPGVRSFEFGGSSLGYIRSADEGNIDRLLRSSEFFQDGEFRLHAPEVNEDEIMDDENLGTFELVEMPVYKQAKLVSYDKARDMFSFSSADKDSIDVSDLVARSSAIGSIPEASYSGDRGDDEVAVALGSAFHEAAEYMISAHRTLSEDELSHFAHSWNLTKTQGNRLRSALERWTNSSIRQMALGWEHVEPEAKFCTKVSSKDGEFIEGAIDLLCYDQFGGEAFVIDYKTGDINLSAEQIKKRHALQANYYAHILFLQGFKKVTCAFVCVEVDGGEGQPFVVEYEFNSIDDTKINV